MSNEQRSVYTLTVPTTRRERPLYHVQRQNESYVQHIAETYGWELGGEYPGKHVETDNVYIFPHDTVIMYPEEARNMGIKSENDFYGGIVPEPFLATKVIMHPLVSEKKKRPSRWSDVFARTREENGPLGYAVFSKEDAKIAADILLQKHGVIRGKDPTRAGGRGQIVIRTTDELEYAIDHIDQKNLDRYGYIFEIHLRDTKTLSIGQSRINEDIISYYGTQRQRCMSEAYAEYAGTDLIVVRGGYDQLFQIGPVNEQLRQAIEQVVKFHRALGYYEEIMVSRMNVDVVQGYDEKGGNWFSILTDTSLRSGSAPDVHALLTLKQDSESKIVYGSSYDEFYQDGEEKPVIPEGATIHFHGKDEEFKQGKIILIYSTVREYKGWPM